MTRKTYAPPNMALPKPEIVGPYSRWPRQSVKRPIRAYAISGTAFAAAAVFAHCIAPLI